MSNHSGSYMLNETLHILEKRGVFTLLGSAPSQELVLDIIRIAGQYDCNSGEILEEIGQRLGICYYCENSKPDLKDGVCEQCRAEWEKKPSET